MKGISTARTNRESCLRLAVAFSAYTERGVENVIKDIGSRFRGLRFRGLRC